MRECHICILPGQTHHALRDELARATKRKTDAYINQKRARNREMFVTKLLVLPCPTPSPLDRRKTGRSVTGYTSLAGSDPLPPLDRDVGLGAADVFFWPRGG